jgi:hypothetical protein
VRHRLQRAPSLRTRANVQRAETPPPPPAPPPQYFAATGRFCRRPCCSSPSRRRSASPAPPPGAIAPHRRSALRLAPSLPAVARDAAGASPRPSPRRRRHGVEPTVNMAPPRRSPVCSQGMRLRWPPSFLANFFLLASGKMKSFHIYICRVHHPIHRMTSTTKRKKRTYPCY